MLALLAGLVVLLTALDHWTTWLCLSTPVSGWSVSEANPVAARLFEAVGLVPGLAVDSALTAAALVFVLRTGWLGRAGKSGCLLLLAGTTGFAVVNNLEAAHALGLLSSPPPIATVLPSAGGG